MIRIFSSVLLLGVAFAVANVVVSQTTPETDNDQSPSNRICCDPTSPDQKDLDQTTSQILQLRNEHGLGTLLGDDEDLVILRNAIEELAANDLQAEPGPLSSIDGDVDVTSPEAATDATSDLIASLRNTASLLDRHAEALESDRDQLSADIYRNLAQRLRLEARSIESLRR